MRTRRTGMLVATLLLLAACLHGLQPAPARGDVNPDEVRRSIDRAIAYLKREQRGDGTWSEWPGHTGGITALCTLALLNAGVPPEDPQIQKALNHLRGLKPSTTYATALQTMALCAAQPKRDLPIIRQCAKWFESTQNTSGRQRGAWSYPRAEGDNSNTQFALLALHEAERVGVSVSDQTWRLALNHWESTQNPDGSWGYQPGAPGTGSMTCAGIASVVIASARLHEGDARVVNGQVKCCVEADRNVTLEKAQAWLGRNFAVQVNPGRGPSWLLYYLYGAERAGRLTAQRFFGRHDWYREGVEMLVRTQDDLSGFWKGVGHGENDPHVGTSFALLFLAKGRRPIVVGKLQHGEDNEWNQHRHDINNLIAYTETKWERELSWQVIDPAAATVDDLLQAPVLFFNGRRPPQFTDEEVARLREYVDNGGFIFAEGCCDDLGFDEGFRLLMKRVFPEAEYNLRLLGPDHPVWHTEERVDPEFVRPLWGIDVGCRTSVIYSPEDLSCYWELARPGHESRLPAGVRVEVAAANAIGVNVLAYATNREVKYKYEITPLAADVPQDPAERAKLYIAKVRHTGGWDAAPSALVSLQKELAREVGLRVSLDDHEVTFASERIYEFPILFMHGRNEFRLSEADREHLRAYVERGGFLLADAVCGSEEFARAFRREMAATFADHPFERIPADHPLLTQTYGGFALQKVQRRETRRRGPDEPITAELREVEPDLEGILIGDRYGVVFSRYDLSCALERHESLECQGYTRDDAARIAINAVLYALHE